MYDQYVKLLKERGIKSADVARATGINPSVFSDWKNKRTKPRIDTLRKIADYFGVPVDYFTGSEKTPFKYIALGMFSGPGAYYTKEETAETAQELFENKEMKILFDAAKDCSAENLKKAAEYLMFLKSQENNE